MILHSSVMIKINNLSIFGAFFFVFLMTQLIGPAAVIDNVQGNTMDGAETMGGQSQ